MTEQNINAEKKTPPAPPPAPPEPPHSFPIHPFCQNYAWGKVGHSSIVASLMSTGHADVFKVDEALPYAEMWMGTHVNGPNVPIGVPGHNDLREYLNEHPEFLGDAITTHYGKESLPFLLKVLSISKALSIQAHPNKDFAHKLHAQKPESYPDKNHKPEMAIAITQFEALCGFRPYPEIVKFLREVAEFRAMVTEGLAEAFCQSVENKSTPQIQRFALKAAFSSIYDREPAFVKKCVEGMLDRLRNNFANSELVGSVLDLLEKLQTQFPGDVGIFCVFFFNRLVLKPGQAIFLGANEPHAYISGDCVECMANSDNVVRAGLTPKFKDVKTLCSMLNYEGHPAESKYFEPNVSGNVFSFKPPVHDFAVMKVFIPAGADFDFPPKASASIVMITRGDGAAYAGRKETGGVSCFFVKAGSCFFVGANQHFRLQNMEREMGSIAYRAHCPGY